MYITRINNVEGYKELPDGFSADFSEDITYIIGENFKGKTTIGSLFNWCMTGTTLYGKEREQVSNDKSKTSDTTVDISFVDNLGIEHRLIRNKGKEMTLILDGKEIEQGNLAQFYKDKDIFLVAHNPYYFYSLEPKDQKDLFKNIVPLISAEDAFEFLNDEEKNIIGGPIEFLNSYTEEINDNLNGLKKEYDRNSGMIQAYKNMALIQEGEIQSFDKEDELKELQEQYETILINCENSNLEDLQRKIDTIDKRLKEIFQVSLVEIKDKYKRENEKLKNMEKEHPICHYCKQEIKNSESLKHLKQFQEKELAKLQEKANELKKDVDYLTNEKKKKLEIFDKLNTPDMKKLEKEKNELKSRIDILLEEKSKILLNNKEVQTKQEQVREAKSKIKIFENAQKEIEESIKKNTLQKKVANKLKVLIIEKQQDIINQYLDKVNIVFSKINKSNDKVTECCDIQYEGRDYKKLSKSEQAMACLEISNVFNNLSGIKAPIFFDDAESCTNIRRLSNTQMVVSLVIKYNPLEILDDYFDVLDRKKKSIEREIQENTLLRENAA